MVDIVASNDGIVEPFQPLPDFEDLWTPEDPFLNRRGTVIRTGLYLRDRAYIQGEASNAVSMAEIAESEVSSLATSASSAISSLASSDDSALSSLATSTSSAVSSLTSIDSNLASSVSANSVAASDALSSLSTVSSSATSAISSVVSNYPTVSAGSGTTVTSSVSTTGQTTYTVNADEYSAAAIPNLQQVLTAGSSATMGAGSLSVDVSDAFIILDSASGTSSFNGYIQVGSNDEADVYMQKFGSNAFVGISPLNASNPGQATALGSISNYFPGVNAPVNGLVVINNAGSSPVIQLTDNVYSDGEVAYFQVSVPGTSTPGFEIVTSQVSNQNAVRLSPDIMYRFWEQLDFIGQYVGTNKNFITLPATTSIAPLNTLDSEYLGGMSPTPGTNNLSIQMVYPGTYRCDVNLSITLEGTSPSSIGLYILNSGSSTPRVVPEVTVGTPYDSTTSFAGGLLTLNGQNQYSGSFLFYTTAPNQTIELGYATSNAIGSSFIVPNFGLTMIVTKA